MIADQTLPASDRVAILGGDCRRVLKGLPSESVQCCVTSPPYYGLRDYNHPDQIGHEKTPDEYVQTMRQVFAEVWRVLRDDGTLWLNLGDSYSRSGMGGNPADSEFQKQATNVGSLVSARMAPDGVRPKNLLGIPWRVALALQADGWYLRSDIIWAKRSCMPESVTDRPTRSHEYIFLLTKRERYYYDHQAIMEPAVEKDWQSRIRRGNLNQELLPTDQINGIRPRGKYMPNAKRGLAMKGFVPAPGRDNDGSRSRHGEASQSGKCATNGMSGLFHPPITRRRISPHSARSLSSRASWPDQGLETPCLTHSPAAARPARLRWNLAAGQSSLNSTTNTCR